MNSALYGKQYTVSVPILKHLQNYANDETIRHILSSGKTTYSSLKKIKHKMENGQKEELGGDTFYNWVNQTLSSDRNGVDLSKRAKEHMPGNQYNQRTDDFDTSNINNMNRNSHHSHNDDIKITEALKRINQIISKII